ncbi:MAG: zinc-ribbon domain-containing protein [Anaerolineae bacterium]
MIYCPNCGTANRDGSKFCNECGTGLAPQDLSEASAVSSAEPLSRAVKPPEEAKAPPTPVEQVAEVPSQPEEVIEEAGVPPAEAKAVPTPVEQVAEGPPQPEEVIEEAGVPPAEATETILRRDFGEPLRAAQDTAGPLAGIRSILPIEPIPSTGSGQRFHRPRAGKALVPSVVPTVGVKEAELFEEAIAAAPLPVVEPAEKRRERILTKALHWFIYILIALAVIVPLILGTHWFGSSGNPASVGTTEFYEFIEALPSDSVVLVAYDYDPATAAEMTLQAEAIVHHLMERDLRIVAVSLFPAGPGIAQEMLDEAASEHGYQYGEDYINLGYLPDQPASLRAFVSRPASGRDYRQGRAVAGFSIAQDVHHIQDIVLIIELAGGQDTLRWWVEQVGSPYSVQMVAGVTASLEPNARPYHHSGQLSGLISGLPGAAEYERLSDRPGGAMDSLDSQSLAHLAIVGLIVLGNLGYMITRWRKRL